MKTLRALRSLLLAIAAIGYLANGAQAHLKISNGESLTLMLCGTDSHKTVELEIPGDPAEEVSDTCCGDCSPPSALSPPRTTFEANITLFGQPLPMQLPERVSPRSPLWPGAPPHGPPTSHRLNA